MQFTSSHSWLHWFHLLLLPSPILPQDRWGALGRIASCPRFLCFPIYASRVDQWNLASCASGMRFPHRQTSQSASSLAFSNLSSMNISLSKFLFAISLDQSKVLYWSPKWYFDYPVLFSICETPIQYGQRFLIPFLWLFKSTSSLNPQWSQLS